MRTFYRDFAACYGTLCLVMLGVAVVSHSHIDTGWFGFLGFPMISLLYAWAQGPRRKAPRRDRAKLEHHIHVLERRLERAAAAPATPGSAPLGPLDE